MPYRSPWNSFHSVVVPLSWSDKLAQLRCKRSSMLNIRISTTQLHAFSSHNTCDVRLFAVWFVQVAEESNVRVASRFILEHALDRVAVAVLHGQRTERSLDLEIRLSQLSPNLVNLKSPRRCLAIVTCLRNVVPHAVKQVRRVALHGRCVHADFVIRLR